MHHTIKTLTVLLPIIISLVALFMTFYQVRLSNKHQLFSKRLEHYQIVSGLFILAKDFSKHYKKPERVHMGLNLDFSNLTNNSYMESVQPLFSVDLTKFGLGNEKPTSQETEIRLNFLKKMEAILSLGQEAKFLYRPETSQPISDFCQNYRDAVNEAYHYEMILQDLKKQAKQPALIRDKTFDEFADESGEPKYRKKLTDAFENLAKTTKELEQGEIFSKMEKQISLVKI